MKDLGRELLARLVGKLGGVEQAAAVLGVKPSLIQRFLDGTLPVPDQMLIKAVDYIVDSTVPLPVVPDDTVPLSVPPKRPRAS